MRLILLTILAAALVFGGTLLFAGYFGTDEGPSVGRTEYALGHVGNNEAKSSLWHCPQVERIMAVPLPEVFRVQSGELSSVSVDFDWVQVTMMSATYDPKASSAIGDELQCNYAAPREPHEPLRSGQYIQLTLVRGLNVEIDLASDIEDWWQVDAIIHGSAYLVCQATAAECEFTVVEAE